MNFSISGIGWRLDALRIARRMVRFLVLSLASYPANCYADQIDAVQMFDKMRESLSFRSSFRYVCTVDVQYDDRPPERHEIEWLYDVLTPQFRVKFRRTGQDGDWNWLIQKPSEHIYKPAESKYLAVESGKANIKKGRFVPIDGRSAIFAGTGVIRGRSLEELLVDLSNSDVKFGNQEGKFVTLNLYRLGEGSYDVLTQIELDISKYMLPVKCVHKRKDFPHTILGYSNTTWERFNGEFVPLVIESKTFIQNTDQKIGSVVSFEWLPVDEVISDGEFCVEAIEVPIGTHVVNRKLGTPYVERIVGREIPATIFQANKPPTVLERGISNKHRLIFLTVLVVVLVGIGLLIRNRLRPTRVL